MQIDVMAAGHLCIDLIPAFGATGTTSVSELLHPGTLIRIKEITISTGGAVANTGIALQKLGMRVCFCARIGDDDVGQLTLAKLRRSGGDQGISIIKDARSSCTIVLAPPGTDRIFLSCPSVNDTFSSGDLSPDLIGNCRLFHFGYPPLMKRMYEDDGAELSAVFSCAKKAGATTSCDMALPDPRSEAGRVNWRSILGKALPSVDLFLPSIEETLYMIEPRVLAALRQRHGDQDITDFIDSALYSHLSGMLLSLGSPIVGLKTGHRGMYLRTGSHEALTSIGRAKPGDPRVWAHRELWCPALKPPRIASATGSGDSTIAGFLAAYLRGMSPDQCLRYGTCAGFQNVQAMDALSGIASFEETTRILESDTPLIDPHLDGAWRWDERLRVYRGPNDVEPLE